MRGHEIMKQKRILRRAFKLLMDLISSFLLGRS
jgi:hypothetical protein